MARLIGPIFEGSPLVALPILSLLIFFGFFVVTLLRTYRRGAKEYDALAAMPLDDGETSPGGER